LIPSEILLNAYATVLCYLLHIPRYAVNISSSSSR